MTENNVFCTNDMSFAAYLTMHSVTMISAKKLGRSYKFTFQNSDKIEKLRFQYIGSESSKFDDAVRKLKKLVYGDNELS